MVSLHGASEWTCPHVQRKQITSTARVQNSVPNFKELCSGVKEPALFSSESGQILEGSRYGNHLIENGLVYVSTLYHIAYGALLGCLP